MFASVSSKTVSRVKFKVQTKGNERDVPERLSGQSACQQSPAETTGWLLLDGSTPNLKAIVYNQGCFATFCLWIARQIGVRA